MCKIIKGTEWWCFFFKFVLFVLWYITKFSYAYWIYFFFAKFYMSSKHFGAFTKFIQKCLSSASSILTFLLFIIMPFFKQSIQHYRGLFPDGLLIKTLLIDLCFARHVCLVHSILLDMKILIFNIYTFIFYNCIDTYYSYWVTGYSKSSNC